ncbi:hypothetical protein DNTS_014636 [Danionella cerebrum]|uniref:Ig-like domain-containing protein n=1 Tax=Danionella cerebrum TaxID=2873325 RepID=A0A553R8I6_9TELE|nr:hypothetical protein DNTS_014636 [Danionella translucida]
MVEKKGWMKAKSPCFPTHRPGQLRGGVEKEMAPMVEAAPLMLAVLCMLLVLPSCLWACPRSCSCPSPKEVHCAFRHLTSAPRNVPKDTERLNLGYNSIDAVAPSDFLNLHQLEMLMLHGNDISSVSSGTFYHLRSLQMLKLSYNKLQRVDPSLFEGLTSLVRLHLDHNLIDFIEPFSFNGLTSLKLLQLEGNRLKELHPHTFITVSVLGTFWSSGLRHLHLADNQLESLLPATLQHFIKLEVLTLHGNLWACDCHLHWLLEWNRNHEGVIKCKKEAESRDDGNCAACFSPQPLNNSQMFQLSNEDLTCDRPSIQSPLRTEQSGVGEDQEPDVPYIKDLELPLGHLSFFLSDSHGNRAHVACNVTRPVEGTSIFWEPVKKSDEISVNVTLRTQLECEIDREALQNLWRLVAYYYESPAILERESRIGNSSTVSFRYSQATSDESPYFTELKGHIMAEPAWLLQPRVTLQLNRRKTTTKKLVLNFSTVISKKIIGRGDEEDVISSWALIQRAAPGRIQTVVEHSEVSLGCSVLSSGKNLVEWMLPDLTIVDQSDSEKLRVENDKLVIKNASVTDSGLYHCFVRSDTNVDIVSLRLVVRMLLLSPSDLNGKMLSVEEGDIVSLPCIVTSPRPVETRWYLPSSKILKASDVTGNVHVLQNNTLIIRKVNREDAGEYSCSSANLYGADMLSHLIEVTGRKEEMQVSVEEFIEEKPLLQNEGDEGSGYEEVKHPIPKLTPHKADGKPRSVITQQKKMKERKPNISIKDLDPSHWEKILTKTNAKPSTVSPVPAVRTAVASEDLITTVLVSSSDDKSTKIEDVHSSSIKQSGELDSNPEGQSKPNISDLTLIKTDSKATPETQQVKQVTNQEKVNANNSNQRRRFPFRQRRPSARRPQPTKPGLSIAPFTQSPVKTSMTISTQIKDPVASTFPPLYPGSMLVTENPPKIIKATFVRTDLNAYDIKIKHSPEEPREVAPTQINRTENSQTNNSIRQTSTTVLPNIPNYVNPPEKNTAQTTKQPSVRSGAGQKGYSNGVPSEGLPIHPWRFQKNMQPSPDTNSSLWSNNYGILFRPTDQTSQPSQSQDDSWYFLQAGGRGAGPPVKPTHASFLRTIAPQVSSSHLRDQLLFNRLRNRFRQSQIEAYRHAQQGKLTPSKPRMHQATDASHVYHHLTAPTLLARTDKPPSTASIQNGDRWHYNRFGANKQGMEMPFPNIMGSGIKPRITAPDSATVSALAEADIYLSCRSSGDPEPVISWTKVSTGATFQTNTKLGPRFEVLSNGTFVIKNIQLQDRGQYLCTSQNRLGSDRMVVTLVVQTQPPKIMASRAREVSVLVGSPASLDCVAVGKPEAQISWILPDRTFVRDVTSMDQRVSLLANGTLRITSANLPDNGDYKCIASNAVGADTLTYHIRVSALPPTILQASYETVSIHVGGKVYMDCAATGEPSPLIKWIIPNGSHMKPTQFLESGIFVFPNGTLYIKNITPSDSGKYECSAANPVGLAKRAVLMDVRQESLDSRKALYQQHSVRAEYGATVFLHCPESMESSRGTVWRLPSKDIVEHHYSPQRHITAFPNGTLRILRLTENDGGNYLCMYQRPNGEDMELFQVEVLMRPPRIENTGAPHKRVNNGENFSVDCIASGLPDPEVSWSLPDGTMINNALQSDDSGTRNRRYFIFGNGTLLLQQMGKTDEGNYTCFAKNTLGEDAMKVSVRVMTNSPQTSSVEQEMVWGSFGQSVQMKCDPTAVSPHTIIWISPSNELVSSSSVKYQTLNDGTLVVKKLTLADQGKYVCVDRNPAGDRVRNFKLLVEVKKTQINGESGQTRSKALAVYYQTVMLDCKVEGIPEPQITWTTPYGMTLPTPYLGGRFQVHRNGTLELRGIRKTDEGRFLCKAKNYLGEATLEVELEVAAHAEKPSFAVPNIEVHPVKPDSNDLSLVCHATGKPKAELLWILPNGTALNPGVKLQRFAHYKENGSLLIIRPGATDKGVYRCLAKNLAGQAEKRYALELGQKPQIRSTSATLKISFGQTLNLPCSADGWPQASITWTLPNGLVLDKPQVVGRVVYLSNGTLQIQETSKLDRGTYTCKARNTFGTSTLSYPVSVLVFPPQITHAPPSMTRVTKGSPVVLNCVAVGVPKPDISWTLPGRTTLVPNNRFSTQSGIHMTEEGHLVIQYPSLMNSGIYKCNARNALGTDFKATYLQVN